MPNPHDTVEVAPQLTEKQLKALARSRQHQKRKANKALVRDTLNERNINPVEKLLEFAEDETHPAAMRIGIWKELLKYMVPQMKALDITANVSQDLSVQRVMFGDTDLQMDKPKRHSIMEKLPPELLNSPSEEVVDVES